MAAIPQQNFVMTQPTIAVQTVNSAQQQIAIVGQQSYTTPSRNDPRHRYKNTLRGLGITECVIGGLSVLLAAIANSIVSSEYASYSANYYGRYYYSGYYNDPYRGSIGLTFVSSGIWCGIFVIITGILGIRVKNTPTRCMYVANMTLAIITACDAFSATVMSGFAAGFSAFSGGMVVLHSIITILCFVSLIITIIHSAFCCSGVCYSSKPGTTQRLIYPQQQYLAPSQPQYVQDPNGQLMMVVNQPIIQQTTPQPSAFQQQPQTTANPPVATQMPPTNPQQPEAAYENVSEKQPPSYNSTV